MSTVRSYTRDPFAEDILQIYHRLFLQIQRLVKGVLSVMHYSLGLVYPEGTRLLATGPGTVAVPVLPG